MAEISYFWDGVATGDAVNAPYSSAEFSDLWDILFSSDNTAQGPIGGYLNELAVSGASSPLSIATGAALVKGRVYKNTTAATIVIPTPAASTRIDLVVLHVDENAQTIRIARVAGIEGGGAPALTQNASGPIWEIALAQVSITTGGVCTVTDKRSFVRARIAPGYEQSVLAASDGAFTAGAWNSIGTGMKITINPGVWLLQAVLHCTEQIIGGGTEIQGRIYNNTTSADLARSRGLPQDNDVFTLPIGPYIATITAQNEIELQFYAATNSDVVWGQTSVFWTALYAIRVG